MPISDFEEPRWIDSWNDANPSADTIAFCGNTRDFSPLVEFPNLRRLLLMSAYQEQLELIGTLTGLESLEIRWLRSVTDFEPLGNLVNLQSLSLMGNVKGISLEPIGRLTGLRKLSLMALVSTAVNGGKVTCESFKPLVNLVNLEYLELFFIKPLDKDMMPLAKMKWLRFLEIPNSFPLEDMAMLSAALSNTEGIFHKSHEIIEVDDVLWCKKCGGHERARLIGSVKGRIGLPCPICDAEKISKHDSEYQQLRERFAREPLA